MTGYCVKCNETREVREERRAGCTVWVCATCGHSTDVEYDDELDDEEQGADHA